MRMRERLCVELEGVRLSWNRWCVSRGLTPAEGVRQLIEVALRAGADDIGTEMQAPSNVGEPRMRIEIRLTHAELHVVEQRAVALGLTSNRWIVALIRAQLLREPQLGLQEMQLMSDSNQQLATINRWLGQLAREAGAAPETFNASDDIRAIREQVNVHLRIVANVIRANLDRWSR